MHLPQHPVMRRLHAVVAVGGLRCWLYQDPPADGKAWSSGMKSAKCSRPEREAWCPPLQQGICLPGCQAPGLCRCCQTPVYLGCLRRVSNTRIKKKVVSSIPPTDLLMRVPRCELALRIRFLPMPCTVVLCGAWSMCMPHSLIHWLMPPLQAPGSRHPHKRCSIWYCCCLTEASANTDRPG